MFILFASNTSSGVYYCFLQIRSNVMQNSILKKFSFGMQMICPPIMNILASMLSHRSSGITGICHAVKTESECIVIPGNDNLKYQYDVKRHP